MRPIEKLRRIVADLEDAEVDGFVLATARQHDGSIECRVRGEADEGEMSRKLDEATLISGWQNPESGPEPGKRRW